MDAVDAIALTLGVAWASGINLYATILVLGWLCSTGDVVLPQEMQVLTNPNVILAAGVMYFVEFFADKTPGVDTGWDVLHTFVRIPAGALLAASAASGLEVGPAAELVALVPGGGLAATSHATKTGTRVLINTSPEPVSNWTASILEDLAVIGGMWAALNHPALFIVGLVIFLALVIWLLPKIWRAIKRVFTAVRRWFRGEAESAPGHDPAATPDRRRENILHALYHDADAADDKKP